MDFQVIGIFIIVGVIFIPVGIISLFASENVIHFNLILKIVSFPMIDIVLETVISFSDT